MASRQAEARVHARVDLHAGAPSEPRVLRPAPGDDLLALGGQAGLVEALRPSTSSTTRTRRATPPRPARRADLVVPAPDLADVLRRDGRDGGGDLPGPGQQGLVGHDLDDQAPVARRLGVDVVAGEAHAAGPVDPDELGQPDRQAATGHDADPGVGVGEARPLRRDEEVAAQGQLQAAGHGRPVDGADDRGARAAPACRSA